MGARRGWNGRGKRGRGSKLRKLEGCDFMFLLSFLCWDGRLYEDFVPGGETAERVSDMYNYTLTLKVTGI